MSDTLEEAIYHLRPKVDAIGDLTLVYFKSRSKI